MEEPRHDDGRFPVLTMVEDKMINSRCGLTTGRTHVTTGENAPNVILGCNCVKRCCAFCERSLWSLHILLRAPCKCCGITKKVSCATFCVASASAMEQRHRENQRVRLLPMLNSVYSVKNCVLWSLSGQMGSGEVTVCEVSPHILSHRLRCAFSSRPSSQKKIKRHHLLTFSFPRFVCAKCTGIPTRKRDSFSSPTCESEELCFVVCKRAPTYRSKAKGPQTVPIWDRMSALCAIGTKRQTFRAN